MVATELIEVPVNRSATASPDGPLLVRSIAVQTGTTSRPVGCQYRNACGSYSASVYEPGTTYCAIRVGLVGSATSNRDTCIPFTRPLLSADRPTPIRRPFPAGWRYAEYPSIFSSPVTRGEPGSRRSSTYNGSVCRNVTT